MATPSIARRITNPKTRLNWRISDFLRWCKKIWFETQAKMSGRGYYCTTLAGEDEYNLTINSDLTVSCNCQDVDGLGHIGDLRKSTFDEIFFGPAARHLRDELAKGKVPIPTCAHCAMKRLPPGGVPPKPRLPYKGMLLENTVVCNVDCIGCAREGAAATRTSRQMSLADLTRMSDLVARLGLKNLFYLNLGEPFLSPNICQELPILRAKNPDCRIVVSTNGVLLNTDAKREAALSLTQILFSVHGINEKMLTRYMHRGKFDQAYAAMKEMVAYRDARGLTRPILEWKYVLFNWNDHPETIQQAIRMAQEIGVDIISFWPTHNPFYGTSWRWHLGQFKKIGIPCWKGREVVLRPEHVPMDKLH